MSESSKRYRFLPWIMLSVTTMFYFYEFMLQVSPGIMKTEIKQSLLINDASFGLLSSVYFYAYALMQIPMGILIDRLGARKLLTLAAFFCATGMVLFGTFDIFSLSLSSRFLVGMGSSVSYIGCAYIIAVWFPVDSFATILGCVVAFGMMGAVVGEAPIAYFVDHYNWQSIIMVFAVIGFVLSALFYTFIRDPKRKVNLRSCDAKNLSASSDLLHNIKHVVKNKQMWICAIYGGLMYTPVLAMGTTWGVPFIAIKYNISKTVAAGMVSTIFIGFSIGSPIIGWLSDRFSRRKIFMLLGAICSFIFLSLTIYLSSLSLTFATLFLLLFGFASSGFILVFSTAKEINPLRMVGTSMGLINGFNMMGAAIFIPIIGLILTFFSNASSTLHHYEVALTILLVIQIIAFITVLKVEETYARSKYQYGK